MQLTVSTCARKLPRQPGFYCLIVTSISKPGQIPILPDHTTFVVTSILLLSGSSVSNS